jgi:hypothetical protein
MTSLAAFQDAFARALAGGAAPAEVAALVAQPGFAVYRNTTTKGCIDALHAQFPAVARLTGDEWFRAAARDYVRETLPEHPSLLLYGGSFPDFLASFPPAAGLPYLAPVARLDRAWTEAHVAADAPALHGIDFVGRDPDALGDALLVPHPAARWHWAEGVPALSIWRANRAGDGCVDGLGWIGEGALLTRREHEVEWIGIDLAACRFLDACADGATLAQALEAALDADPHADLARLVAAVVDAGAVTRIVPGAARALGEPPR